MAISPFRQSIANLGQQQTGQSGFNSYAAGDKRYGFSARRGPNTGMTLDQTGYNERDRRAQIRKNLMLRQLKAGQAGRYLSSDYMTPTDGIG